MSNLSQFLGGAGGMKIKSIQTGTINLSGSATNVSATINPVDVDKSVLHNLGFRTVTSSGNTVSTGATLELANSTTVRALKTGTSGNVFVNYQIVEYEW